MAEEQANYKIIGFKIPRLDSDEPKPDNFAIQLTPANYDSSWIIFPESHFHFARLESNKTQVKRSYTYR